MAIISLGEFRGFLADRGVFFTRENHKDAYDVTFRIPIELDTRAITGDEKDLDKVIQDFSMAAGKSLGSLLVILKKMQEKNHDPK